jgi:hypothetical protein
MTNKQLKPKDEVINETSEVFPTLFEAVNYLIANRNDLSVNQRRLLTSYFRISASQLKIN